LTIAATAILLAAATVLKAWKQRQLTNKTLAAEQVAERT